MEIQPTKCIEHGLRDDEPAVFLAVSGYDVPRRMTSACRGKTFLIGRHVFSPEISLPHVGFVEFPVLFRIIDAADKSLSLFFLGDVEEELQDFCSVPVEMVFEIEYRLIAVFPDSLLVQKLGRDALVSQDFRMYTDNEHLFIIRPVEDTDSATLREALRRPPEKVMIQFNCTRMFEAEDLATLRIDSRHH